jgi:hypothetical protein
MIAMAVMEGYEEIGVYGVDMAQNTEYDHQRPSCEYFLGFARGRGIKVTLPKTSDLLQCRWLYGFEDDQRSAYEARVKEIYDGVIKRKQAAEEQVRQAQSAALQYTGAIDAIQTLSRVHV